MERMNATESLLTLLSLFGLASSAEFIAFIVPLELILSLNVCEICWKCNLFKVENC